MPSAEARRLLAPYTGKDYLADELKTIEKLQKQKREPWGAEKINVYEVAINGRHARIRDCQDVSKSGLADVESHEVIPESTSGPALWHVEALLDQDREGAWRLIRISILDSRCTPPTSR